MKNIDKLIGKIQRDKQQIIEIGIYAMILVGICLININKVSSPCFVPDEMGYWTAAAWLNGYDWSAVMSNSGYYGFGYGILLAPLFFLKDSILMFRAAVVINVIMLLLNYFLLCNITKRLLYKISDRAINFCCFIVSLYSYYIVYAQLTQAEIFLTVLFTLSCYNLIRIAEKGKLINYVVFAILMVLMFASHFRTVVMIIAAVMVFAYMFYEQKIDISKASFFFIIVLIGVVITFKIKDLLVLEQYTNHTGEVLLHNDFSSRVGVLGSLLTIDGIVRFILGVASRLFYLGCSTFFLFYWGVVKVCKDVINNFIKKEKNVLVYVELFVLLSSIGSIALGSLSMMYPSRIDQVLYGRYFENVVQIIIIFGIYDFFESCNKKKYNISFIILQVVLGCMTYAMFYMNPDLSTPLTLEMVGIAQYWGSALANNEIGYSVIICAVSLFIAEILYLLNRRGLKKSLIVFVGILWIYLGMSSMQWFYDRVDYYDSIKDVAISIQKYDENEVYYILSDYVDHTAAFYDLYNLQFDAKDFEIQTIKYSMIDKIQGDAILILHKGLNKYTQLSDEYEVLWENSKAYLLKLK